LNPARSCGESYKLDDGGRSRRPTKVSASHQGRADGHAAPRFPGHGPSIDALRRSALGVGGFHVAFDVIASGDEDIVTSERTQAIRDQTGAACVAWEGSGAARAALFNGIGSLEIRAVTDAADKEAPQRFDANLPIAMANLASLLGLWLE
jgi:nucleoside phosphorylase